MTYHIEALPAEEQIILTGGPVEPFSDVPGAVLKASQQLVKLPFTQESANFLYSFLRTADFQMEPKTRRFLRILANGAHLQSKDWAWELSLVDLQNIIVDNKARKYRTGWDYIHFFPLRYVDKSNPQNVGELTLDTWSVVIGNIVSISYNQRVNATFVTIVDNQGQTLDAAFFNQRWLTNRYKVGAQVVLSGTYSERYDKRGYRVVQLSNATIDLVVEYETSSKIVPVYSEAKSGKKKWLIVNNIAQLLSQIGWINDPVPETILKKYGFMSRDEAYRKIHFAETMEETARAKERIAFDDFLRLQVFLRNKKDKEQTDRVGVSMTEQEYSEQFIMSLPFDFTGAQKRVTQEIRDDMASDTPMRRLLHGDVGSGKSEVALAAALTAVKSGKQVALLAPTGILAAQLEARFKRDIEKAELSDEVTVGLLINGLRAAPKRAVLTGAKEHTLNILIGTHSILSKGVEFDDLGLIIIDEQHKFGTKHREALVENFILKSGITPDMLMMSATPIPRTMTQTIFGDMDLSVIDEYPEGRKSVITYWDEDDSTAWAGVRDEVLQGRQAYVIAALVEESESEMMENVENATATHTYLSTSVFPETEVGLVHGKMKADEKEAVLQRFYDGEIKILVSTSVIEVGVNVPNASAIVILNANRFGIASLHQIRGRVGRGNDQGYCYLIGEATTPDAEDRLSSLVASTDGFWLAEVDLEIRGEGTLLKDRQHGKNDLLVGNLREHSHLIEIANRIAPTAQDSVKLQEEVKFLYGDSHIKA